MAMKAIAKPKPDMLTPAVQALVGDILTEVSRLDTTPIDEYIEMVQTSPVIGPLIQLSNLIGIQMFGDYQNSVPEQQDFIRRCEEQMRGSFRMSVDQMLCVRPLGFACSEWAPIEVDGKWMLDAIQIIDPRKYRFRGRKGAIEDLLYTGDSGDVVVPYDRVIHLVNQSHISFGSPYGVAECRRALAAYRGWKIVIAAALIAAKRRGEPVTIGFAPSDQQVKVGEDDLGNPIFITAPQALLNTLADLENNSVAATDLANRIETIEAAEGGLILEVLNRLQQLQLMAFLVPESILSATGVGDSNLNTGHRNILNLTVGGAIDQIKERLIEDVIRPLLIWEFGENVEDFGEFQTPKAQEDGAIELFNALTNALYNGVFPATDLDVINRMRDLAGLPTVAEIVAPLQGAPTETTDPAVDPNAAPVTDPAATDPTAIDVGTFAAPKAKGKAKGKGEKNCKKGINCGGTCISAKKVCKNDNLLPTVKAKATGKGKKAKAGGGGGGGDAAPTKADDAGVKPIDPKQEPNAVVMDTNTRSKRLDDLNSALSAALEDGDFGKMVSVAKTFEEQALKQVMAPGEGDKYLKTLYVESGYDGKPRVVTEKDLDKATSEGATLMLRGLVDSSGGKLAEQFRTGDYWTGGGGYGNGTYAAHAGAVSGDKFIPGSNAKSKKRALDALTSNGYIKADTANLRMALPKDAKVTSQSALDVEIKAIAAGIDKWRDRKLEAIRKKSSGPFSNSYKAEAKILKESEMLKQVLFGDYTGKEDSSSGRLAVIRGYDAIALNKSYEPESFMNLLNRSKVLVQDTNLKISSKGG